MDIHLFTLLVVCSTIAVVSAWSPYYPVRVPRAPLRTLAPPPPSLQERPEFPAIAIQEPEWKQDIEEEEEIEVNTEAQRPKRNYRDDYHHDFDSDHDDKGITGPVHTFVKTDKNANYKWGVRHHVGNKFAS